MKIFRLLFGLFLVVGITVGIGPAGGQEFPQLNRELLNASIESGKKFLLKSQKPDGSFTYEFNFIDNVYPARNSQVRQAGALWGLALLYHDEPRAETREALARGTDFFIRNSEMCPDGGMFIKYPGDSVSDTGTLALVTLSLVDWLRAEADTKLVEKYRPFLERYIRFLLKLRNNRLDFFPTYTGCRNSSGSPSPYADGESLLALVKAAKYMGFEDLRAKIIQSADAMYAGYVVVAGTANSDSPLTKAFYQWGSMAFHEMFTAGWGKKYATWTIGMGNWIIENHEVMGKPRNTAYAYEGLSVAWECARLTGNAEAMDKFGKAIGAGLYRLISWQVGSPNEVGFLKGKVYDRERAFGGVMNGEKDPILRIDVTQHQVHAYLLAKRFLFAGNGQDGMKSAGAANSSHLYEHFTPARLEGIVRSGADFLVRMQAPDGRFNYFFNPATGKSSAPDEDNFLRQAGTALSVLTAFEMTRDSAYYRAAMKSLDHLLKHRKDLGDDKSYFLFQGKAMLGGAALPMLVLLKLRVISGTDKYDDLIGRLAGMIMYLQEIYDKGGMFKSTYVYLGDFNHEKTSKWESNIYPGEALYAMSLAYKTFKKEEYRQCVDQALAAYRKSHYWTNGAFIPWALYALREMHQSAGGARYAADAFQMADYLLADQNNDFEKETYGSFYANPTIGSASNLEGIGNAVFLAKSVGDGNRFREYSNRLLTGIFWLERLQVNVKTNNIPGISENHNGGFMYSLQDPTLRIDNTQHAISAVMQALKYVY